MTELLTRGRFRKNVFERDGQQCVVRTNPHVRCPESAVDAHHILERKLWGDDGYYLENGASVCERHHLMCEQTLISVENLREWCGITKIVVPEHLYHDTVYDKWGNPILPNGTRMRGELFEDEGVQKILAPILGIFTMKVKYPRTYHLPCSPGVTKDDCIIKDVSAFLGADLILTIKMDGENTTMYPDGIHARSLEYAPHKSRDWVKALHARIAHNIPRGWRICGENLFAKHSIHYQNLEERFQVFGIWDGLRCLSWDDTIAYCNMLELKTVQSLPRFNIVFNNEKQFLDTLKATGENLIKQGFGEDEAEGFVLRLSDSFQYGAFKKSVAKYVRAHHVQTHGHWMRSQVTPNEIR